MSLNTFNWNDIEKLKDYQISFFLYKEGKSIKSISIIRNLPKTEIEKHIIKGKIEFTNNNKDTLLDIISMNKTKRLGHINTLSNDEKEILSSEIYTRYTTFKNPDDRMILIWLIGELKNKKLLPFLRMELKSKNVNYRRLACSALGKIKDENTKTWLEALVNDSNPQVRQYAIKSLGYIGDKRSIEILQKVLNKPSEKEYVKKVTKDSINLIKESLNSV